jgi:hypothetical protein
VRVRRSGVNDQQRAAKRRHRRARDSILREGPLRNPLAPRDPTKERKDLHNANIDAAGDDLCGTTHLQDGRICLLAALHVGLCEFELGDRRPS